MESIFVGIRIPKRLHRQLIERADSMNASKTQILLESLRHYLMREESQSVLDEIQRLKTQVESLESLIRENVEV